MRLAILAFIIGFLSVVAANSAGLTDGLRFDAGFPANAIETTGKAVQSIFGAPARAEEAPAQSAGFRNLLKLDGNSLDVRIGASVSLEARTRFGIRKIGFGIEKPIELVSTNSGSYSADALGNPHVLYPGVIVTHKAPEASASASFLWETRFGSQKSPFDPDSEYMSSGRVMGGGIFITGRSGTCIAGATYLTCL